jgi:hypothetical protein
MANVWQHRIKCAGDGLERAVGEQQLAKAILQFSANRSMAEA